MPFPPRSRKTEPSCPGSTLARSFRAGRRAEFHVAAEDHIAAGRDDVVAASLAAAGRDAGNLMSALHTVAEAVIRQAGPVVCCDELFAVVLRPLSGGTADPVRIAEDAARWGLLPEGATFRCSPGWFRPDDVALMSPCDVRRTLRAVLAGTLPPGLPDSPGPSAAGYSAVLLVASWTERDGVADASRTVLSADDAVMDDLVRRWADEVAAMSPRAVSEIIRPCSPSMIPVEMANHAAGHRRPVSVPVH